MTEEQVFVSHAPSDLDAVQDLFSTVRNLPFDVYIALEEIEPGRSRHNLEGRLANSDVVVAVLTDYSVTNQWVHQEIGYAVANGIPIVPVYGDEAHRGGYVSRVEGVELDHDNLQVTIFNLLSRLRAELAPLGALSVPSWFLRFPCNFEGCDGVVTLELEDSQKDLWKLHEHDQTLETACGTCGSVYAFDPATLGFLDRQDGSL